MRILEVRLLANTTWACTRFGGYERLGIESVTGHGFCLDGPTTFQWLTCRRVITDHLSHFSTKSSGLLLRSTSCRCWACTRFGGYERLGIESVTGHGFCLDGPTTFQWLTCRRVITDHLSHFSTKSSGLLLRSTSCRCWACTRFGGYERLGIESVTGHGFCLDGPTTFQWLTCRRVITDHLSHFSTKSSGLLLRSTSCRCWACTRFGGYERLGIESVTSHGFCLDGPTAYQWLTCRRVIADHLSHFSTKSSGLLLRSTSCRCWACTRFGGYERLGIESVTGHGFCLDGPTTFQWLTCRRVITDHLSHFSTKSFFRLTASFHILQMLSLHSIWWIWKAWYWISYKSWILFRWTHNFSMVNMQKSYHRSFESFLYKIFRLTASFHILQMLSLHSIWWIWKAWYWISYKSWILFWWTRNFLMVNMQKSYHRSFESFLYKIFRLTASFHILQMLSLHSIWWIWKAWY